MSRTRHTTIAELIRSTDPAVLWKAAAMCDGHGILDPQALIDAGLPPEVVEHYTETLRSDGTLKGSIFVDGRVVETLDGVYGLRLLEGIAAALNVEYRSCLGRGFQAQAIQSALRARLRPAE